jgi:tetratricopeptide (TPR) repeat protein
VGAGEDVNDNAAMDAGETNNLDADTDDDAMGDGLERDGSCTDPLVADTDGDTLYDGFYDVNAVGLDVYPIPVFGVINDRPNGPCINTGVDMELVEEAIGFFMNSKIKKSTPNEVELHFLKKVAKRLPEDIKLLQALAELYTKTGQYEAGLRVDIKLSHLVPNDDLVWYNLGCSYALTERFDEAFDALAKSIDLGYSDYDWMKTDPDLGSLYADPRFESLLNWLYTVCNEEEF